MIIVIMVRDDTEKIYIPVYIYIYIYNYDIILILGTHEVLKQRGTSKNSEAQRGHVSSYDCSEGKTTYIGYHKIFVR